MIRRNGVLPRKKLQGRRVVESKNEFNEITGTTLTTFSVNNCTIQPFQGNLMSPDLNGFQSVELFTLYTETPLLVGIEGSNRKADEVFIYDAWYRVIKVSRWSVGIIPHYECVCAKLDVGLS